MVAGLIEILFPLLLQLRIELKLERRLVQMAAAALVHLPLVRLFATVDVHDVSASKWPPFCSQACAMSDRIGGGVDPVPHLADRLTLPADLARSPFYRYRFTLTA